MLAQIAWVHGYRRLRDVFVGPMLPALQLLVISSIRFSLIVKDSLRKLLDPQYHCHTYVALLTDHWQFVTGRLMRWARTPRSSAAQG